MRLSHIFSRIIDYLAAIINMLPNSPKSVAGAAFSSALRVFEGENTENVMLQIIHEEINWKRSFFT